MNGEDVCGLRIIVQPKRSDLSPHSKHFTPRNRPHQVWRFYTTFIEVYACCIGIIDKICFLYGSERVACLLNKSVNVDEVDGCIIG